MEKGLDPDEFGGKLVHEPGATLLAIGGGIGAVEHDHLLSIGQAGPGTRGRELVDGRGAGASGGAGPRRQRARVSELFLR